MLSKVLASFNRSSLIIYDFPIICRLDILWMFFVQFTVNVKFSLFIYTIRTAKILLSNPLAT